MMHRSEAVFVDTGAWFAAFVPSDRDHARADQWLRRNDRPLVTLAAGPTRHRANRPEVSLGHVAATLIDMLWGIRAGAICDRARQQTGDVVDVGPGRQGCSDACEQAVY